VSASVAVPVLSVAPATPRSLLLSLDVRHASLPFTAGQAVVIGRHGQAERRPYSIACAPERAAEGVLELLIGTDAAGDPGPHLAGVTPGALVDVEGPLGSFTFPGTLAHPALLFVAGGTGIAPLRAMLDHARRRHPERRLALLYSARRSDEFAFIDELRALEARGLLQLHQTVTRDDGEWEGSRGRIGRAHFEAVLHDAPHTLCFVCGPSAMVTDAVTTLASLGVPEAAIRTEQWVRRS